MASQLYDFPAIQAADDDLSVKITATFAHGGRECALAFDAGADDATNLRKFKALMFSMRQTNRALLGLLGTESQIEVERLTA